MRSTKFQASAFLPQGGTLRRQTNDQTLTKGPMAEIIVLGFRELGGWKMFGSWILEFEI
jgi:hypothetical protein